MERQKLKLPAKESAEMLGKRKIDEDNVGTAEASKGATPLSIPRKKRAKGPNPLSMRKPKKSKEIETSTKRSKKSHKTNTAAE